VRSWQHGYRGLLPDSYLDALDVTARAFMWRRELSDPGGRPPLWLADTDGDVVGFAGWGPARDSDLGPRTAELYVCYVEPERWGQGIGTQLLGAVLASLGDQVDDMVMWVLADNTVARRFYEHRGAASDGTRRTVERGGIPVDDVRYRMPVRVRATGT
jgi:GNAT superfamily N-acetyltransferase